jgi:hypothetical protein
MGDGCIDRARVRRLGSRAGAGSVGQTYRPGPSDGPLGQSAEVMNRSAIYIYIYIYIYITSPALPISRGSPGPTLSSGSAEPGSSGYKNIPRPQVIRF